MKRLLALLMTAALLPACARAVELGESGAPLSATPLETTAIPVLPAAALPGEALKIPAVSANLDLSSQLTPQVVVSPAAAAQAATAQENLTQTAARLDGKQDAQALTASFDGSKKLGAGLTAGAIAVAASPAAPVLALTPALSAAYEAWRIARAPKETRWRSPDAAKTVSGRVSEAFQLVPALFVSAFLLLISNGLLGHGAAFGVAAGLMALIAGLGTAERLARERGIVVQRWQASHDQKYRTDYSTGQMKDIRGHRYGQGSDRYDEMIPGRLAAVETAAIRLISVGAVLALGDVLGAQPAALLAANLVAAAGFALHDRFHKPRPFQYQAAPDR